MMTRHVTRDSVVAVVVAVVLALVAPRVVEMLERAWRRLRRRDILPAPSAGQVGRRWCEPLLGGSAPSILAGTPLLSTSEGPVDSAVTAGRSGQPVDGLALARPALRADARPRPAHRALGQLVGLRPPTCPQSLGQLAASLRVDHTDHRSDDDDFFLFSSPLLADASERARSIVSGSTAMTASEFGTPSTASGREDGGSGLMGKCSCRRWGNVVDVGQSSPSTSTGSCWRRSSPAAGSWSAPPPGSSAGGSTSGSSSPTRRGAGSRTTSRSSPDCRWSER